MGRVDGANSEGHRMERKGQGAVEGNGTGSGEEGLDKEHGKRQGIYGRGWTRPVIWEKGALVAPCYVWSHLLPFINNNLFNKNDLLEKSGADVPGIPGAATNNKAYYLGVGWMGWVRD